MPGCRSNDPNGGSEHDCWVYPDKAKDKVTVQNFRRKVLRELKKIKTAWPDLHYTTAKGVLILSPSKPAIAATTGPQRLVE